MKKGNASQSIEEKNGPFPCSDESPRPALNRRRSGKLLGTTFSVVNDEEFGSAVLAEPPFRRYECSHYEGCLDTAAALNWKSFTCRGCCGMPDEQLQWRAHHARRVDPVSRAVSPEVPPITCFENPSLDAPSLAEAAATLESPAVEVSNDTANVVGVPPVRSSSS